MITLKIEGTIDWEWKFIFTFLWLYFGVIGLYVIAFCLILVMISVFALFQKWLNDDMDLGPQLIGLLWQTLFHGLSIFGMLTLVGISEAYDPPGNYSKLKLTGYIGMVLNLFSVIYTLIVFPTLIKFLMAFNSVNVANEQANQTNRGNTQIEMQVEKKESYFVMLSSTYFLPLNSGFRVTNEANLEKVKKMLGIFNPLKKRPLQSKGKEQKARLAEKVNIKVLKDYKEDLDKKFSGATKDSENVVIKVNRAAKFKRCTIKLPEITPIDSKHGDYTSIDFDTIAGNIKKHLSAEDLDAIKGFSHSPAKESKHFTNEDNLCYLCYERAPNAILFGCGHGGICYECALMLVQKKNECMQCRGTVDFIYKVDPNPKMKDIIKGVEMSKVIKVQS